MRGGVGARALRESSYGIYAGHHVKVKPEQDELLRELFLQAVEVPSLQSGHFHRDGGLHNSVAPQCLLFHYGFANAAPAADHKSWWEA